MRRPAGFGRVDHLGGKNFRTSENSDLSSQGANTSYSHCIGNNSMNNSKIFFVITALACFPGCGGDHTHDRTPTAQGLSQFASKVQEAAGAGATNCGIVEAGKPELTANTCVADSFSNAQSFFAVYHRQGIDSTVAQGISGDSSGRILRWQYDSNPSGGVPGSPASTKSTECTNAALTGSVDGGLEDIFSCS